MNRQKILVLTAITTALLACNVVEHAASAQTTNTIAAQQLCDCQATGTNVLAATVIAWEKESSLLIVDAGRKILRIKVKPGMVTLRAAIQGRKPELAPGQEISIVFKAASDLAQDVACLIIEPSSAPQQAASSVSGGTPAPALSPFGTFANPANTSGRIISPSR